MKYPSACDVLNRSVYVFHCYFFLLAVTGMLACLLNQGLLILFASGNVALVKAQPAPQERSSSGGGDKHMAVC